VLKTVLESWSSLYSNHAALRTGIEFLHIGGLLAGGGCAIAADRTTLMAMRDEPLTRAAKLSSLKGIHRIVLAGLFVVILSGLLLFGADVDTYLYSKVFWIKMGLMLLLMVNGVVLIRAEHHAEHGDPVAWTRLAITATASLALWLLTTLAGAALPNIG
jgi:uncharacterized membrane protein